MTYEEKYKKLVDTIHKELQYSQLRKEELKAYDEMSAFQGGKVFALKGLLFTIKQMESEGIK